MDILYTIIDNSLNPIPISFHDEANEASKTFWSLVSGGHEDQIYLHIGHVDIEKGVFDLAGVDK